MELPNFFARILRCPIPSFGEAAGANYRKVAIAAFSGAPYLCATKRWDAD